MKKTPSRTHPSHFRPTYGTLSQIIPLRRKGRKATITFAVGTVRAELLPHAVPVFQIPSHTLAMIGIGATASFIEILRWLNVVVEIRDDDVRVPSLRSTVAISGRWRWRRWGRWWTRTRGRSRLLPVGFGRGPTVANPSQHRGSLGRIPHPRRVPEGVRARRDLRIHLRHDGIEWSRRGRRLTRMGGCFRLLLLVVLGIGATVTHPSQRCGSLGLANMSPSGVWRSDGTQPTCVRRASGGVMGRPDLRINLHHDGIERAVMVGQAEQCRTHETR